MLASYSGGGRIVQPLRNLSEHRMKLRRQKEHYVQLCLLRRCSNKQVLIVVGVLDRMHVDRLNIRFFLAFLDSFSDFFHVVVSTFSVLVLIVDLVVCFSQHPRYVHLEQTCCGTSEYIEWTRAESSHISFSGSCLFVMTAQVDVVRRKMRTIVGGGWRSGGSGESVCLPGFLDLRNFLAAIFLGSPLLFYHNYFLINLRQNVQGASEPSVTTKKVKTTTVEKPAPKSALKKTETTTTTATKAKKEVKEDAPARTTRSTRKRAEDFLEPEEKPAKKTTTVKPESASSKVSKTKAKASPKVAVEEEEIAVANETDSEAEAEEDDQTAALLAGFESSDDENDPQEDDGIALDKIPAVPNIKEVRKQVKDAQQDEENTPGVIYIGRLPHGFFEAQMREYFSQFGDITHLRMARNKLTGRSKHYAFIEFGSAAVAEIVAKTMDKYLLFGHLLQVRRIPAEQVHEKLWKGEGGRFKVMPRNKIEGGMLKRETRRPHSSRSWVMTSRCPLYVMLRRCPPRRLARQRVRLCSPAPMCPQSWTSRKSNRTVWKATSETKRVQLRRLRVHAVRVRVLIRPVPLSRLEEEVGDQETHKAKSGNDLNGDTASRSLLHTQASRASRDSLLGILVDCIGLSLAQSLFVSFLTHSCDGGLSLCKLGVHVSRNSISKVLVIDRTFFRARDSAHSSHICASLRSLRLG
ncbi:RNA-binding domain-containing protein, partial [Aureobasidium melanogenum]